jgi:hypothetical protein
MQICGNPRGNLLRPFVSRLECAAGAAGATWVGVIQGFRHRAIDQPVQLRLELSHAFTAAGRHRHHHAAKFFPQLRHIDLDAIAPRHIHHVQRHHHRTFLQLQNLADEKQVPFEVRRIHDDERGIRGGMFQLALQRVGGQFFIRRFAVQAVEPRQIHHHDLLVVKVYAADLAFYRRAGKIRRLGAQTRQRVEQSGFARVGIADQRQSESVVRVRGRGGRDIVACAHAAPSSFKAQ